MQVYVIVRKEKEIFRQSIQNEIDIFEKNFRELLSDRDAPVQFLLDYLSAQQGGRLRPGLLLLSAGLSGGITEESRSLACMVELLHTASLIHDDIVDDAQMRRHVESVNAVFDNKLAVLLGDYLLTKVLDIASRIGKSEIWPLLSDTVSRLTRGEMLQLSHWSDLELAEADYFRFLEWKTASLMELSCRLGALSAGASAQLQESCGQWGSRFGIFFQLKDDLKDFAETTDGKERYSDLRQGVVTLPVIYAMQRIPMDEQLDFRRNYHAFGKSAEAMEALAEQIRKCGALEQAAVRLGQMQQELQQQLETFPDNAYRRDLQQLIEETGDLRLLDIK